MDKIKSFLLIILICCGIVFPNIIQHQDFLPLSDTDSDEQERISKIENYEKRLDDLRILLASAQFDYFRSLLDLPQKEIPGIIKHLSETLRREIINLINKGTSSEAIVALNKANVKSIMKVIQTYENHLGESAGVRTTEWNVLTDRDLQYLSQESQKNLKILEKEILKYPKAEVPSQLIHRKKEFTGWHNCIKKEIAYRSIYPGNSQLPRINKGIPLEKLNKIKSYIDMVDGPGKNDLFIKEARLQVELRLHHSPNDASLQSLRKLIPSNKTRPIIPQGPINGPPSRLKNPVQRVLREINNAYELEFDSIITRNPVGIAEARSKIKVYSRWLDTLSGRQLSSNPLSFLDDENLFKLKINLSDWLSALNKEKILKMSDPRIELEIKEASSKYTKIVKELADRNLYYRNDPLFRWYHNASKSTPYVKDIYFEIVKNKGPPPELIEFEKKMEMYKNHFNAVELRKALDKPKIIPDQSLQRAYNKTIKEVKNAERKLLLHAKGEKGQKAIQSFKEISSKISSEQINKPAFQNVEREINNTLNAIKPGKTNLELSISPEPKPLIDNTVKPPKTIHRMKLRKELNPYIRYQRLFPENKSWAKTYKGIIKDIRRAPGGVIIDFSLSKKFMNKVKEVRFDIFCEKIFILIEGHWKVVEPSVKLTTLRQALAFVDDGRVAAVDLRMLSAQEQKWLLEPIVRSTEVLTENSFDEKFKILQNITVVNLHPAFIDTEIGGDLILADQVIFDLLPDKFIRVEGENKRGDIDITGLFKAYNKDFHFMITQPPPSPERSILKSIISIKSGKVYEGNDNIKIIPGIDFAVYLIPEYKSNVEYTKIKNSSGWFNMNKELLTDRIKALEEILKLASYVGLFKSVRNHRIPHNLNDLVFTETEIFETPQYLYHGNDLSIVTKILNGNK